MKSPRSLTLLAIGLGLAVALQAGAATNATSTAMEPVEAEAASADKELQDQLLQAYIRLQAQLNEAQLAIEKSRAEYESSARKQATEINDKLSAIQSALEVERNRQQEELRKSNQTLLWVAGAFGCAGMLAMLFTAMFQWRTMNRVSEISTWRPQLTSGGSSPLLPAEADVAGGKAVELSNQRLMAVIERLERRVFELEHSTGDSGSVLEVESDPGAGKAQGGSLRIGSLLSQGQSLLNEDKAEEALKCYDEILEFEPTHPEALVKKGAALERLKQDEEALRCYDRAIEADRTLTIAYLYKGGIYNRLERYNEALECYEKALRAQGQPG